ncbi:ING4 protein, partial [Atractosteus spatula]|nr:ING4 protein [Atractosteus spatula]
MYVDLHGRYKPFCNLGLSCLSPHFPASSLALSPISSDLKGQIDGLAREYTANARTLSSEQKLSLLRQIQQSYSKCKEFGDDKVQLAMQTYEMSGENSVLGTLSELMRSVPFTVTVTVLWALWGSQFCHGELHHSSTESRGPKEKKVARTRSKVKNSDDDSSPKNGQKKVKLIHTGEYSTPSVNFGNVHPSDVLDMPVDPNEPTYCLCHQVSYGEMIGCDNTDCSIEWFHFACVGLTTKPRGKW